jgi:hypothetical protein
MYSIDIIDFTKGPGELFFHPNRPDRRERNKQGGYFIFLLKYFSLKTSYSYPSETLSSQLIRRG